DQTCGVEGCSIRWNLQLIRDSIAWVEDRRLPLMVAALDQAKASIASVGFFLFRVFGRLGFSDRFRKWIKILYMVGQDGRAPGDYLCNGALRILGVHFETSDCDTELEHEVAVVLVLKVEYCLPSVIWHTFIHCQRSMRGLVWLVSVHVGGKRSLFSVPGATNERSGLEDESTRVGTCPQTSDPSPELEEQSPPGNTCAHSIETSSGSVSTPEAPFPETARPKQDPWTLSPVLPIEASETSSAGAFNDPGSWISTPTSNPSSPVSGFSTANRLETATDGLLCSSTNPLSVTLLLFLLFPLYSKLDCSLPEDADPVAPPAELDLIFRERVGVAESSDISLSGLSSQAPVSNSISSKVSVYLPQRQQHE
ncbi:unnamed protein product, partial [Coregonus sp. 'balchen']